MISSFASGANLSEKESITTILQIVYKIVKRTCIDESILNLKYHKMLLHNIIGTDNNIPNVIKDKIFLKTPVLILFLILVVVIYG